MAREKVLVVGAGGIAGAWFPPILAEKLRVCGVVDLRRAAAQERIAQYNVQAPAFTSLSDALAATQPDFVIDLTVPDAHCAVTCEALQHGLPVIGEKPMAASMPQARRMVRAAAKAAALYMVSQSRRWDPLHAAVANAVRAGAIGRVTTINCDFYVGAHFGGFRDEMPSPLILDMAIHHFDLARFFCGVDPQRVYACEFNPRGSWYNGDVAASCIFEMDDGVVFTYRGSWCAEGCHTSWNGNWRIIGDNGTIVYEQDRPPHGEIVAGATGFMRPKKPLQIPVRAMKKRGMHGALAEMLAYLRTGAQPQTECRDNIKSLAMVFAAIESARHRRRIPVRC